MKRYRIVYSEQQKTYKIQHRVLFMWLMMDEEYESFEDAKLGLSTYQAYDWKEVNNG